MPSPVPCHGSPIREAYDSAHELAPSHMMFIVMMLSHGCYINPLNTLPLLRDRHLCSLLVQANFISMLEYSPIW